MLENVKIDKFRQSEILRSENVEGIRQAIRGCEALNCKGLEVTRKYKNRQAFTENGNRSENGERIRQAIIACSALIYKGCEDVKKFKNRQVLTPGKFAK